MGDTTRPPLPPVVQESYIVSEGKKRGATREVRAEAAFDRFYTVVRVHPGDAILTDNWHSREVGDHVRANFEGLTFAMRTLEARGALVESDRRAIYTAGGRVWVFDLEPAAAGSARHDVTAKRAHPSRRRHSRDRRTAELRPSRPRVRRRSDRLRRVDWPTRPR